MRLCEGSFERRLKRQNTRVYRSTVKQRRSKEKWRGFCMVFSSIVLFRYFASCQEWIDRMKVDQRTPEQDRELFLFTLTLLFSSLFFFSLVFYNTFDLNSKHIGNEISLPRVEWNRIIIETQWNRKFRLIVNFVIIIVKYDGLLICYTELILSLSSNSVQNKKKIWNSLITKNMSVR